MSINTRNGLVAQLVRALACHARGRGFEPHPSRHNFVFPADLAHLVERDLAKVEVAGSSPVIRSIKRLKIGYNLESFSTKSAFCGINPLSWMKSLRDEICLTAGYKRRI